jgi:hypothetical protein
MIHVSRIPLTPFFRKDLTMHQAVVPFAGVFNNVTSTNIEGVRYRARQAPVKTTWVHTSQNMQPLPAASKDVREMLLTSTLSHEIRENLIHSHDGRILQDKFVPARQSCSHAIPFCVTGSLSFDEKRKHRQQQCTSFKSSDVNDCIK